MQRTGNRECESEAKGKNSLKAHFRYQIKVYRTAQPLQLLITVSISKNYLMSRKVIL